MESTAQAGCNTTVPPMRSFTKVVLLPLAGVLVLVLALVLISRTIGLFGRGVTNDIINAVDPACSTDEVTLSLGPHSSVAGDATRYPLVLTNHTSRACAMIGTPTVRWAETPLGPTLGYPVGYVGTPQVGASARHDIYPSQHGTALLTVTHVGKWVSAACVPVAVRYVEITLNDTTWATRLATTVCVRKASATISAVAAS